ncbi:sodium-dependent serotonin transporter-like [Octopus vulgaris]|uniref:Transporter n=3 Tax=Octopus TaxID=6643 RepID=A0AA36AXH6_OCTVU|nr:sodium-dependent serotonin transporter-like [Octopus vulgaris]
MEKSDVIITANTQPPAAKSEPPEREQWGKKAEFLLSVIGFAVDLGNVWRFPYICYRNGGGAFLVPYFLMLLFLGLPMFYMELCLGQFHRCGPFKIWRKVCPIFYGIGYAIGMTTFMVGFYYNTIIAWSVFYLFSSFTANLPWSSCNNTWNTEQCISLAGELNTTLITNTSVYSADEYYNRKVLESHLSNGIGDIGPIKGPIVGCLAATFIVIYFSLWKGIKSSGKAVWITATVPYIVIVILLIRGCTLPGSSDGILYYLRPKWHMLKNLQVWVDAASQICFSLGTGFGTLIALSSYNKFNNNCYLDAMATSVINCFTSFLAGFVVFSVLGYMAYVAEIEIDDIAVAGPGLVFVVYPEAVSMMSGSTFWAIIFFLMLITLGLDSTFGGLESLMTGFTDEVSLIRRHREVFVAILLSALFLLALPTTTYGGQYVVTLLDSHAGSFSLLFICFAELIAVQWCYGVKRFSNDVEKMIGRQPSLYWKFCWAAVCPCIILGMFCLSIYSYTGITLGDYQFPKWAEKVGWTVSCSSMIGIPVYIIYKIISTAVTREMTFWELIGRGQDFSLTEDENARNKSTSPKVELKSIYNGQQWPHHSRTYPELPS